MALVVTRAPRATMQRSVYDQTWYRKKMRKHQELLQQQLVRGIRSQPPRPPQRCRHCDQPLSLDRSVNRKLHPECVAERIRGRVKRDRLLAKAMATLLQEEGVSIDQLLEGRREP